MNKNLLYLIITLTIGVWFSSFIIHMPIDVQRTIFGYEFVKQPVYMDVYSDDYKSLFIDPCIKGVSKKWFNSEVMLKYCSLERVFPLPYRDYYYDKPFLTGLFWLLTTSPPSVLGLGFETRPLFFYVTFSIIVAVSLVIHVIYLYRLSDYLEVPFRYRLVSTILLSSVIYSIYSWEAVSLVFLTLFIYYYVRGLSGRALLMLSLFSSMNLYGLVIVSLVLYQYLVFRDRVDYASLLGLTPLVLSMSLLFLLSPGSLINQLMWFDTAFCNNCIFLVLTRDPYSDLNRFISFTLWISTYLAIIPFKPRGLVGRDGFGYLAIFIVLTNVFLLRLTPQQLLYMLPYLPLLYVYLNRRSVLAIHYVIDVLNSAVIILWFRDAYLRKQLSFLGLQQNYNPLGIDSPIQWIAQSRNIALLTHTLIIAKQTLKPKSS